MYAAYVRNTKFTSPSSLAQIGFMQKSLVEIFSLDSTLTYQYSFIYIRQLAIHLRNAITNTKEVLLQRYILFRFILFFIIYNYCFSIFIL